MCSFCWAGLFCIAFAVVDSENEDNWKWFLEQLSSIVSPCRKYTFMSDRNKGLLEAVSAVFPDAHHSYCLRHLKANLRDKLQGRMKSFKDTMVRKLGDAAYTPDATICQTLVAEIKAECKGKADSFFENAPIQCWSNAYFLGNRYGEMTSNAAESFNAWIVPARNLPALQLVDTIRGQMMEDFTKKRKLGLNMKTSLCSKAESQLKLAIEAGRTWEVAELTSDVYEVKSVPSVFVKLSTRECTCCQWQLNGFPCAHAVASIVKSGKDLLTYVEKYFHVEFYRLTYDKGIYPIPTLGRPSVPAEDAVVLPPLTKNPPGRPHKKRFRRDNEKDEKGVKVIKCSRCKKFGHHNRKTCKAAL